MRRRPRLNDMPRHNIVYHFLSETELTSVSEKVIREAIIEGLAIPMIVYNELLYTTGAKIARIK